MLRGTRPHLASWRFKDYNSQHGASVRTTISRMLGALSEKRGLPFSPPPPPLAANGKALYYGVWRGRRRGRVASLGKRREVRTTLWTAIWPLWVGSRGVVAGRWVRRRFRAAPRLGRACPGTLASLPARGAAGSPVLEGRPKPSRDQGGGDRDGDLDRPSLPLP